MDAQGKKKTLLGYLARGVAMIHLDARREGVIVPPRFKDDPHLRLNISYRYAIPDLEIDERRVQATLSFGGMPFQCIVPWEAIFGITSHASGDGQVWPEDLPTEVVRTLAEREDEPRKDATDGARKRPSLVAVDGAADGERKPTPPDGTTVPKRGHLRLVR
jgi:stringent starvation protein B